MKYFTLDEFRCQHCGALPENGMNPVLLEKLDKLRELAGRPVIVTSGYRCPVHNAEVGGVPDSQHTKGNAADITCDGLTVDELADLAVQVGMDGIGRYYNQDFVHCDCRDDGNSPNYYQW